MRCCLSGPNLLKLTGSEPNPDLGRSAQGGGGGATLLRTVPAPRGPGDLEGRSGVRGTGVGSPGWGAVRGTGGRGWGRARLFHARGALKIHRRAPGSRPGGRSADSLRGTQPPTPPHRGAAAGAGWAVQRRWAHSAHMVWWLQQGHTPRRHHAPWSLPRPPPTPRTCVSTPSEQSGKTRPNGRAWKGL